MKLNTPDHFYTREEIARYFQVSRMTLYRMFKVVPLTIYKAIHLHGMPRHEVDDWFKKWRKAVRGY